MKMTLALRAARRWLGWIRYTDRVRYLRSQARQAADVEQTMRTLRDIAEAEQAQAVTALIAAAAAGVQLGRELDAARAAHRDAERRCRALDADLEAERQTVTAQIQVIEQLGEQLGVRGHLAGLTPAARRDAMAAVDPTNEWGWRE